GQIIPAHVVADFDGIAADAARVDRFDDRPAAVAAAEDDLQRPRAGRRLVLRLPADAKSAGVAREILRLQIAAAGPRSDFAPHNHVARRRRRLSPATADNGQTEQDE